MSIVVFGGFSLLTAFATSLNQLTLLRFLTGLGSARRCRMPRR
jgi:AAHS family 4-hydroxybenzoate transporter-like MFS transporter